MSEIVCELCGTSWNASLTPICPKCLANKWVVTPHFIKQKHDPTNLPSIYPSFRSVLSSEFFSDVAKFSYFAAASGTVYFSNKHQNYCYFTATPLGIIPGSAVLANDPMPSYALDGLLIADPFENPHAYAADSIDFQNRIVSGEYRPLFKCSEPGCQNLALPNTQMCFEHSKS